MDVPVSSWVFWACVTNGGLEFYVDVMQRREGIEPYISEKRVMERVTDCEGVDQMDGLRRTAGEE